jgi:hypothetical protein
VIYVEMGEEEYVGLRAAAGQAAQTGEAGGATATKPQYKIFKIRQTRMGSFTLPVPLDETVKVREIWGRTHGEARVSGTGRFVLVNISNLGNHNCVLYELKEDGTLVVLDRVEHAKFCRICESACFH